MFIGIQIKDLASYRVDIRKSIVQYYDATTKNWLDIHGSMITQAINRLKGISQLSFRHLNYVYEIEVPQGDMNVAILLTNVNNHEHRLLLKDEFKIDNGIHWGDLFDKDGNLHGKAIGDITSDDLYFLCNLSKDIITIGLTYYIGINLDGEELKNRMAEIIKLVVNNNEYISTIDCDYTTANQIAIWYQQGCPMNIA